CAQVSRQSTGSKLKTTDFLNVLRKDPKKYGRARELIALDKELRRARATFDLGEVAAAAANSAGAGASVGSTTGSSSMMG
ncbi:hypothetical protein HK102_010338, partial [Quaeritorhiza haematococci]